MRFVSVIAVALLMALVIAAIPLSAEDLGTNLLSIRSPADEVRSWKREEVQERSQPYFPSEPDSCPKCQADYPSISSCAEASSAFANQTSILADPAKYYSIIKCACADTFQAAYPQCLDCFQKTNQAQYLGTDPAGTNAPQILSNIRSICALASSLIGGISSSSSSVSTATQTPSTVDPSHTASVTLGPSGNDQSTGPIFGGSHGGAKTSSLLLLTICVIPLILCLP